MYKEGKLYHAAKASSSLAFTAIEHYALPIITKRNSTVAGTTILGVINLCAIYLIPTTYHYSKAVYNHVKIRTGRGEDADADPPDILEQQNENISEQQDKEIFGKHTQALLSEQNNNSIVISY